MNGALIGFGTIGRSHFKAYNMQGGLRIVAVADPLGARGEEAADVVRRNLRVYRDAEQLFGSERIEFVDICSPPSSHMGYIRAALSRGLHVLCEKPIVHSDDSLAELREALKTARTVVFPAQNYRFAPGLVRLRDIVRSKSFGAIEDVRFRTLRVGNARGVADWDPDWRRRHAISGGGILRDHGPHSLYVIRFVLGLQVREVSCLMGRFGQPSSAWGQPEVEDSATIRLRFDHDVEAQVDLSWASNRRESYYRIQGEKQSVLLRDDHVVRTRRGKTTREKICSDFNDPAHTLWIRDLLLDFLATLSSGSDELRRLAAERSLQEALDVSAAYRSARAHGAWFTVEAAENLFG